MAEAKPNSTMQVWQPSSPKSAAGREADCEAIIALMQKATGEPPKMWGAAIVGFWQLHLQVRERQDRRLAAGGVSPRKQISRCMSCRASRAMMT